MAIKRPSKNTLWISLFGFLTVAGQGYNNYRHDKAVQHQQEYEIFNNNKLDKQECDDLVRDSLIKNKIQNCK